MVATKGFKYPDRELYDWVLNELHKRHINNETIGEIAYEMQHQYLPELTVEDFGKELDEVLKKREVLNILATGFALDNLANEGLLPEPLQTIVKEDAGVYGVDETISLALSQLYGSIAVTNYGYEDKKKLGVAAQLDNSNGQVNTFADDLALALASAVIGRCGHGSKLELDDNTVEEPADIPSHYVEFNGERYEVGVYLSDVRRLLLDYELFERYVINHANSTLSDSIEELIDHDYYVGTDMVGDQLRVQLSDNKMEVEREFYIGIAGLYEYVLCYASGQFDEMFEDDWLAQFINMYIWEKNGGYAIPDDDDDTVTTEVKDEIQDSINKIAGELASIANQVSKNTNNGAEDPFMQFFSSLFGDGRMMTEGKTANE